MKRSGAQGTDFQLGDVRATMPLRSAGSDSTACGKFSVCSRAPEVMPQDGPQPSFHLGLEVSDYMKGWPEQLSLVPAALGLNPLYWELVLSPCVRPLGPPWDLLTPEPA